MVIEDKNYVTISFPCPKSIHKQLKTVASAQGKTIRSLIIEWCASDLFERPENKELLASLK
jgi:hypothetical protein